MVSESGEDLELGPYFYCADGPCFRCSFPQFRQLTPSRQYRVSAPIALHLQIGLVATEIIYLSTRIGSASRAGVSLPRRRLSNFLGGQSPPPEPPRCFIAHAHTPPTLTFFFLYI